jgi:hypothetical protein
MSVLVWWLLSTAAPAAEITIVSDPMATTTHAVFCLASAIQCGDKDMLQITGALSEADKQLLARFRAAETILRRRAYDNESIDVLPVPEPEGDLAKQLRLAGSSAKSITELRTWLGKHTSAQLKPSEQADIIAAFERFLPPVSEWHKQREGELKVVQDKIITNVRWIERSGFLRDMETFFQSPPRPFTVYLVPRSLQGARIEYSEQLAGAAFIEVTGLARPTTDMIASLTQRLVIAMARALYVTAPRPVHEARQELLAQNPSDVLLVAYSLMEDVLAFSMGQRLFSHKYEGASLGAALVTVPSPDPLVRDMVAVVVQTLPTNAATLDPVLTLKIVGTIQEKFAAQLASPARMMRVVEVAYDRDDANAKRAFVQAVGARDAQGFSPIDAPVIVDRFRKRLFSYLPVVFLVKPQHVGRLAKHDGYFSAAELAKLEAEIAKTGSTAWGIKRRVPIPAYVFVAKDQGELTRLFADFAEQPKNFVGAMPKPAKKPK